MALISTRVRGGEWRGEDEEVARLARTECAELRAFVVLFLLEMFGG